MKKSLLLAGLLSFMLSVPVLADDVLVYDTDDSTLVINSVETVQDKDGDNAVLVKMTSTIKQTEGVAIVNATTLRIYQDGKTLELSWLNPNEDPYKEINDRRYDKIKDGATAELYKVFKLASDTPDLEFEFFEIYKTSPKYYAYYNMDTGELTSDAPETEAKPDYEQMYNELKADYDDLKAKYDALVEKYGEE